MKNIILVIILIELLIVGCTPNDTVSNNPNTLDTPPPQPETTDVSEGLVEDIPDWHSIYAPLISAYLAFENGEPPADIIRGSSIVERHYFFLDDDRGGALMFALYDINSSGSPELIIGYKGGNEQEGFHIRVCNVYTIDGGSLNRIISSHITDETHEIYTRSIWHGWGNVIVTITEYSLSLSGALIEEYSVEIAWDCTGHERGEILQESGESLNDIRAELDWQRLSDF